jgi:hypothetical protein
MSDDQMVRAIVPPCLLTFLKELEEGEHLGCAEIRSAIAQWDNGRQEITVWVWPYSDVEVDEILARREQSARETPIS